MAIQKAVITYVHDGLITFVGRVGDTIEVKTGEDMVNPASDKPEICQYQDPVSKGLHWEGQTVLTKNRPYLFCCKLQPEGE